MRRLAAHVRGEAPHQAAEYRVRHRDGSWRWLLGRGRVVARDAAGRALRMVGTLTDVTASRAAERAVAEAEERFRSLSACSPVGIFHAGLDGAVTYANPRLAEIWGVPAEAIAGHGWTARVHPDDLPTLLGAWTEALRAEREFEQPYRLVLEDGRVRWVHGRSAPLRDAAGTYVGVVGTIEDVTARRATDAALAEALAAARESEAWFRASFDAMPGSMGVLDPETLRFVSFNDDACATLGYTRAEFAELTAAELEAPGERDAVRALIASAADGDGRLQFRRRHLTKAGEAREVLVTTRPFESAGRRLSYCTWIDVTDQVRAEEERRALEERLRQAQKMEAVGQLAGGIAHDFNNLLTVIGGNLEFVQQDLPPDHPVRPDLVEIAHASERARALVRQLLTFSRKQPVRPQQVALGELVRGAEKMLRRVIGEEIALAVQVAEGVPPVNADPGQLEQVLMNLAVNARDAMLTPLHGHAGTGGTLRLEVGSVALTAAEARAWGDGVTAGEWVRLVVRDTGHGMDAATRAHVFEPFFTTKAVGAGTGLGLATAFGIVQQAGGAIRVESAPGRGAAFTILLPPDATDADGGEHAHAAPSPGAHALTVLLVEDESPVRVAMRRMLERRGCAVLEARHGADALLVWRANRARVDAVVSDLRMPEMGGRELVAVVRAEDPAVPVVFVSGYSDQAPPADAGPHDAFVEKPLSADALLAALQRVTERRRARPGPLRARDDV
ncbi:PAS domain S-box protein [Roseisolibacter sp. H3M3-2]|uniref:hybrid sensor histidine kinase/response regulator n=1 Tax=Roseisolibacter sp. H3M3-2 TaxID=3031323 RepID=UPI0023DA8BF4|nr:PAS domain S-box protein [Roseisolibacter sp. H3M3-2]MDF1504045.1 PAS domain S-box protein [Roseisolibacter sp. H3M3-2]MDF1504046.1 PAS domain S-box protein [Roseisolibacter sp. H3M3-2]